MGPRDLPAGCQAERMDTDRREGTATSFLNSINLDRLNQIAQIADNREKLLRKEKRKTKTAKLVEQHLRKFSEDDDPLHTLISRSSKYAPNGSRQSNGKPPASASSDKNRGSHGAERTLLATGLGTRPHLRSRKFDLQSNKVEMGKAEVSTSLLGKFGHKQRRRWAESSFSQARGDGATAGPNGQARPEYVLQTTGSSPKDEPSGLE